MGPGARGLQNGTGKQALGFARENEASASRTQRSEEHTGPGTRQRGRRLPGAGGAEVGLRSARGVEARYRPERVSPGTRSAAAGKEHAVMMRKQERGLARPARAGPVPRALGRRREGQLRETGSPEPGSEPRWWNWVSL